MFLSLYLYAKIINSSWLPGKRGVGMASIISVANLKGGVGKTAIAVNFAAYCGQHGKRTLLIDLDPQTNATFWCLDIDDWEIHAKEHGTVADLLGFRSQTRGESAERKVQDIIRHSVFNNVDLIPSHIDLFTIDLDLAGATGRELRLKRAIAPILKNYDIIVCDCPPNLTLPTQNALAASTHYVVPISPDYLSGIGVGILLRRVRQFCDDLGGHQLQSAGMVISREGRPAIHRAETVLALRTQFKKDVLKTQIKERVAVSEAAARHIPIFRHTDQSAINEFSSVSKEILSRL